MAIEKGNLIYWWHYYGRAVYTLEELEELFESLPDASGLVQKILA